MKDKKDKAIPHYYDPAGDSKFVKDQDSEYRKIDGEFIGKVAEQLASPEGMHSFSGMHIVAAPKQPARSIAQTAIKARKAGVRQDLATPSYKTTTKLVESANQQRYEAAKELLNDIRLSGIYGTKRNLSDDLATLKALLKA